MLDLNTDNDLMLYIFISAALVLILGYTAKQRVYSCTNCGAQHCFRFFIFKWHLRCHYCNWHKLRLTTKFTRTNRDLLLNQDQHNSTE